MILTIDIGNTTVGLCCLERHGRDAHTVIFSDRVATVREKGERAYLSELRELLNRAGIDAGALEGAALSSVVPCLDEVMGGCVLALTGHDPVWVTAGSRTGLIMDVPEPEKVGLDRIVDAAWAAEYCPLPAVTVDMGTATTFNVVDEGRVFRGGIIAPGLNTGLQALSTRAAQLPEIVLAPPERVIGRDTQECMRSGAVAGAAAMIDGLTARIEAELGKPAALIITGGLAHHVRTLCTHPHIYDPYLLAKGLALLYDWNSDAG